MDKLIEIVLCLLLACFFVAVGWALSCAGDILRNFYEAVKKDREERP